MKAYHITCSQVDSPTTHIVRYVESRTIIDAISKVLQECYRAQPGEWECTRAELIIRAPKETPSEEIAGVPA